MRLKVFVSSTCNDLGEVRDQLRSFIEELGHEPIMSDYSDIFFHPDHHTHAACVRAVPQADLLILIVGGRFGGEAVPAALAHIDMAALQLASKSPVILSEGKVSITHAEVLMAIESNIPIYTFVDTKVFAEHRVYQTNKGIAVSENIKYATIEKPETAIFIFEFINFMRLKEVGNGFLDYRNFQDIKKYLLTQWSMLFKDKLQESKERKKAMMSEQYSDDGLKLLFYNAAGSGDTSLPVAVFRYSKLMLVIRALRRANPTLDVTTFSGSYAELLAAAGVKAVERDGGEGSKGSVLILEDSEIKVDAPHELFAEEGEKIGKFQQLSVPTKRAIFEIIEAAAAIPGDKA